MVACSAAVAMRFFGGPRQIDGNGQASESQYKRLFFAVDSYRTIPNKNTIWYDKRRRGARRARVSNNKIIFDRQKAYESRKKYEYTKENSF